MSRQELERILLAAQEHRYTMTEHAFQEMADDNMDVLDIEAAMLTGRIEEVLTQDPRGTRYVVVGFATDLETSVAVVVRFLEQDHLLIITVYEIQ